MKNLLAVLFVIVTQVACAAIYAGDPSLNGIASDNWRMCKVWGRCNGL